jgi:crotonobetainyl-CoA:carnitine CoA-transferase CaiB-like acyl-CoA transferase
VIVGTGGKAAWEGVCRALGLERLLGDPRFADNSLRVRHADALREEIESVLVTRPTAHWTAVLGRAQIPCAPVQRLSEVLDSPQLEALGTLGTLSHPTAGEVPSVRLPIRLSDAPSTSTEAPPALNQHADVGFAAEREEAA